MLEFVLIVRTVSVLLPLSLAWARAYDPRPTAVHRRRGVDFDRGLNLGRRYARLIEHPSPASAS